MTTTALLKRYVAWQPNDIAGKAQRKRVIYTLAGKLYGAGMISKDEFEEYHHN